jgi:hypothetical protein
MAKSSKYSEDMVAAIEAAAAEGPLNLARCTELAEMEIFGEAGITARGIVAKARTMGVPYEKVVRTSKNGQAVVRKDELVTRIEEITGLDGLDDLSKAGKQTLRRLVEYFAAESV